MKKGQNKGSSSKIIPHYLIVLLILTVGILVYHRTLLKGVFLFDDNALILDNPLIKNFSHIRDIFKTHLFYGSGIYSNFYRPIQSLSFMLDYNFWQLNPLGYRLSSVLIHVFSGLTVYFFIYNLSKKQDAAIITSLLFSVHTVLSWPVNYIASRSDLLSGMFFFAAALLYVLYKNVESDRQGGLFYFFSIVSFILSILSKEITVIFPLVLMLYLWCFADKAKQTKKHRPDLIWVFFVIVAIYAYLRLTVFNFTGGKLSETTTGLISLPLRLLTFSKVFMIYLRLLFFPIGLHMEWDIAPAASFFQDEVFLSVIGVFAILIFAWVLFYSSRLKFFAIAWFFITLLPYSNIFPLNYFMGEAWLYIPSVGFFALLAIYLSELRKRSAIWSRVVSAIVVAVVIFYGFLTIRRADVWADPAMLYAEVLRYSPNNTKARVNLGVLLAKSGSYDEAIKKYKEVAGLGMEDAGSHANLGTIYANQKNYDAALEEFKKAVELNPKDYVAHNNIGIIYKQKGDVKKAMEEYTEALKLNPNYPLTYNNIGNIYLEIAQYDAAIRFYQKAINIDPNKAAFWGNLGKAYKNKGMSQEARESFEKALQLDPAYVDAKEGLDSIR